MGEPDRQCLRLQSPPDWHTFIWWLVLDDGANGWRDFLRASPNLNYNPSTADIDRDEAMRVIKAISKGLVYGLISLGGALGGVTLAGCTTTAPDPVNPRALAQSALADTHLGWKPAPANQLNYSLATSSGIARMEMRELPEDLQAVTIELPGMRNIEGVQWQAVSGDHALLFDGGEGADGVTVKRQHRGYTLQVQGAALDTIRRGGFLTVIDYYRN
ncbi:hypothetical protein ACNKU7_12300 [Microbulbifer sp. SA54]|uniref:hypothetical protein n=1 Tax=Microbulbifer sp. SA54 TaxID=3401577 RepID=UPI003AAA8590